MKRAAAIALVAACGGSSGTLSISFTGAPGANLLDGAASLRVVLTNPAQTFTAERGSDGFSLDFDFSATNDTGQLQITALDAAGATVAYGATPPLPLDAVTANVVVYMGAPLTVAASPAVLAAAAAHVGGAVLPYGAVLAGGEDGSNAPIANLGVYNAYDHTMTAGLAMPTALSGAAITATSDGQVYFFGGTDQAQQTTSALLRFDTTVSPAGEWITVDATTDYARSGEHMLQIADATFVVTGDPALSITTTGVAPFSTTTTLPTQTAELTPSDGDLVLLGADAGGVSRVRAGVLDQPFTASADRAAVAAIPPDAFVVAGGDLGLDALRIDATTGAVTSVTGALSTTRFDPSIAATSRYVVVAGGTDAGGAEQQSCDILRAADLTLAATVPCDDANGSLALALSNDQILLVPGAHASTTIDLFTPDPP